MLDGKRIAILVEEGFGDLELFESLRAMKAAEARVVLVGADFATSYQSKSGKKSVTVEVMADNVEAEDFDAIIIPGGVALDKIRFSPAVINLLKKTHGLGKVIAAIGHGLKLLILADIVRGYRITSCPSIAIDLKNAGADWVDEPVVQDRNIITSGKVANLPVFDWTIIKAVRDNRQFPEAVRPE
jgi:protease I